MNEIHPSRRQQMTINGAHTQDIFIEGLLDGDGVLVEKGEKKKKKEGIMGSTSDRIQDVLSKPVVADPQDIVADIDADRDREQFPLPSPSPCFFCVPPESAPVFHHFTTPSHAQTGIRSITYA